MGEILLQRLPEAYMTTKTAQDGSTTALRRVFVSHHVLEALLDRFLIDFECQLGSILLIKSSQKRSRIAFKSLLCEALFYDFKKSPLERFERRCWSKMAPEASGESPLFGFRNARFFVSCL